jgi:hypothetical protein
MLGYKIDFPSKKKKKKKKLFFTLTHFSFTTRPVYRPARNQAI